MLTILRIILFTFIAAINIYAQETTFQDSLLDRMTGNWTLKGMIAGQEATYDIEVSWIQGHQYLQLHEISRETDAECNLFQDVASQID